MFGHNLGQQALGGPIQAREHGPHGSFATSAVLWFCVTAFVQIVMMTPLCHLNRQIFTDSNFRLGVLKQIHFLSSGTRDIHIFSGIWEHWWALTLLPCLPMAPLYAARGPGGHFSSPQLPWTYPQPRTPCQLPKAPFTLLTAQDPMSRPLEPSALAPAMPQQGLSPAPHSPALPSHGSTELGSPMPWSPSPASAQPHYHGTAQPCLTLVLLTRPDPDS